MLRLPIAHAKLIAVIGVVFLLSGFLATLPWLGLPWIPRILGC